MPSFEDLPVDDISRRNQLEGAYEKEVLEAAIEASLENSVKCNEGKNALILHLDLASLDKESIDQLLPAGVPEKGQLASKVLKIYVPGEAQKEAGKQEQARRILAESGSDEAAAVPKVYVSRDLEIKNEVLMDRLRGLGFKSEKNVVSLIMMDYIDGPDLAAYIFEKVIKQHPGLADLRQRLEQGERIEEEEMSRRVGLVLDFEAPPVSVSGDDVAKNIITNARNGTKLSKYLRDQEIILDKKIFSKVEQATRVLHANSFFHNDLHERNVMLDLAEDGQVQEVYLIDFATADSRANDDLVGSDLDIVKKYSSLTQSRAEQQAATDSKFWTRFDLTSWEKGIARNQAKQNMWEQLKKDTEAILAAKNVDMLGHLILVLKDGCSKIANENVWQELAAAFFLDKFRDDPLLLRQCLKMAKEKSEAQSVQNFWQSIIGKLPAGD